MNINPHSLSFAATAQVANERGIAPEGKGAEGASNPAFNITDNVSLSISAAEASEKSKKEKEQKQETKDPTSPPAEKDLTEAEKAQLKELKARDKEVKQHEQAHLQVAGQYAVSGASYSWQQGPDGKKYAIGGEVNIDTSEVHGDPKATIAKMEQVKRAALAPAEPSAQDYKVAADAETKASRARSDLSTQTASKTQQTAHDRADEETGNSSAISVDQRTEVYTRTPNTPSSSLRVAA